MPTIDSWVRSIGPIRPDGSGEVIGSRVALGSALVRAGTTSWADRSLVHDGNFYPRKTMTAAARLAFYCQVFSVAEITTTYRFPPTPELAQQWAERSPDGFVFDVRAWSLLSGNPTLPDSLWADLHDEVRPQARDRRRLYPGHLSDAALDECWRRFNHALRPLQQAGRLGLVVVGYPSWFTPRPEAWEELARLRARLDGVAVAVELREREVVRGRPLRRHPRMARGPRAGVRLHRRARRRRAPRAGRWSRRPRTSRVVRFSGRRDVEGEPWTWPYRYSEQELSDWVDRVEALAGSAREVHLVFENGWRSDAVDNARQLLRLVARLDRPADRLSGAATRGRPTRGGRPSASRRRRATKIVDRRDRHAALRSEQVLVERRSTRCRRARPPARGSARTGAPRRSGTGRSTTPRSRSSRAGSPNPGGCRPPDPSVPRGPTSRPGRPTRRRRSSGGWPRWPPRGPSRPDRIRWRRPRIDAASGTVAPMTAPGAAVAGPDVWSSDGVRLATWDFGGTGPPLLLVHATGFHGRVWAPVARWLTATHRVLAYDQRGHGLSGRSPDGRHDDWGRFAVDLCEVLDGLGLTGVAGAGHSMGAAVLLMAEERRPGSFASLYCYEPIVIEAAGVDRGGGARLVEMTLRRRRRFASPAAARENFAAKPPFSRFHPDALAAYLEGTRPARGRRRRPALRAGGRGRGLRGGAARPTSTGASRRRDAGRDRRATWRRRPRRRGDGRRRRSPAPRPPGAVRGPVPLRSDGGPPSGRPGDRGVVRRRLSGRRPPTASQPIVSLSSMALPLPSSLSPSKVSSFKDCALAFRLSAIDRLPEPPSPPAAKGTLVHRALQLLLWEEEPGHRTPAAARSKLARAVPEILDGPEYAELHLGGAERNEFVDDAESLIDNYFVLEDPNAVRVIGTELRMSVTVGSLKLSGIIDRLELDDDGELVVTDYKTGRAPSESYEQGRLTGVQFYAFLCEQVLGRRPVRVQLLHLREPLSISTEPSEQSLRGLRQQTLAVWSAVERACEREDFRPKPGRPCSWCAFHTYCPAVGGDLSRLADVQPVVAAT